MVKENACPACGGAVVPHGAAYIGTLTVCRCVPYGRDGTTWYSVTSITRSSGPSQLDRIEQKVDEILRTLRS